jgi:hypothetical protein
MNCHRCSGTMVHEKFYGTEEPFWGWRCIYCGEVIDAMILENRSRLGKLAAPRRGARRGRYLRRIIL